MIGVQVLREVTLDKLINLYEGLVVTDRKSVMLCGEFKDDAMSELKKRCLKQDKMTLGALKCAKMHGYSGED